MHCIALLNLLRLLQSEMIADLTFTNVDPRLFVRETTHDAFCRTFRCIVPCRHSIAICAFSCPLPDAHPGLRRESGSRIPNTGIKSFMKVSIKLAA
ncbi:predicted ribonuclease subunit [Pseudozyma hubeiensis SY62]|uniref:Predicted ribonuclease subunit n=1 Tax=Pseudozyma hubeiensis (strain SY62) TaxID=1305764 RepID=R9P092_PSEHS|nr:predicted ribonuclease subunit [Pseudozyma hubeiensis SY62]GAC94422.1 predicted ribonuclease subunit [Pseudozyma hubeiensis SY62]